jgi:hypothetical protein
MDNKALQELIDKHYEALTSLINLNKDKYRRTIDELRNDIAKLRQEQAENWKS